MTVASLKYLFGLLFVLLLTGTISGGHIDSLSPSQEEQKVNIVNNIQRVQANSKMLLDLAGLRVDSVIATAKRQQR